MSNATSDPAGPIIDAALSPNAVRFARFVTAVLIIVTPAMIGVIGWRWFTVREPSSAVVISGDGSLDGAQIVLRGQSRVWTRSLTEEDGWEVPFLLHPGQYHVQVTHHGRPILNEDFKLEYLRGARYELPSMVTLIGGPQFEQAQIELQREEEPDSRTKPSAPVALTLERDQHFRAVVPLSPGLYQVTARKPVTGELLAGARFRVDRTAAVHVDLVKAIGQDGFELNP